jgi:hypothetical protein
MVDMVRSPLESAITQSWASTEMENRLFATRWDYTLLSDGGTQLNSTHLGEDANGYGHSVKLHWVEVDVTGTQGANAATLIVHWNAPHPFAGNEILLHSWSMIGDSHEVVPLNSPLPLPHGAHFHITLADGDTGAVVTLHVIEEWI